MELFQNLWILNEWLMYIAVALTALFIVIAGYQVVTSEGDPRRIQQAKMTIFYALIGGAVAFLAYMIRKAIFGY